MTVTHVPASATPVATNLQLYSTNFGVKEEIKHTVFQTEHQIQINPTVRDQMVLNLLRYHHRDK